jgi:hypothetical protein
MAVTRTHFASGSSMRSRYLCVRHTGTAARIMNRTAGERQPAGAAVIRL